MAIKLNIQQAYEDIEVGSLTFRIDLSDDHLRAQQEMAQQKSKEMNDLQAKVDEEKQQLSNEEILQLMNQVRDTVVNGIDQLLEEGAGMQIYEEVGKSTVVLSDVFAQISNVINDRMNQSSQQRAQTYTANREQRRKTTKSKK